uniref:Uncharacterized protein n=1 Tax=Cryptomonas curvata TaxID=233186 RepID=A0A7S0QEA0_9CRYP
MRFVLGLLLVPFTLAFVAMPTTPSGLRSKQCSGVLGASMISAAKKSYRRQFGYPAVTAGKLTDAATVKKSHEAKGEGWIYRAPKSEKFEDGSKFWARIEAEERNAKIDVKRFHNTKTVG